MTTLTLQVTEVQFDFDDDDFTPEQQQEVVDSVLGNVCEVEVFDPNNDAEIADALVEEVTDYAGWCVDALVEEVTDYAGWCVCSLDFVHVLNTH